jgi:hypothetical protein
MTDMEAALKRGAWELLLGVEVMQYVHIKPLCIEVDDKVY